MGVVLDDGRVLSPLPRALVATEVCSFGVLWFAENWLGCVRQVTSDGLFVIDNGRGLSMFVGDQVDPELLSSLFDMGEDNMVRLMILLLFFLHLTSLPQLILKPYIPDDAGHVASRVNLIVPFDLFSLSSLF